MCEIFGLRKICLKLKIKEPFWADYLKPKTHYFELKFEAEIFSTIPVAYRIPKVVHLIKIVQIVGGEVEGKLC